MSRDGVTIPGNIRDPKARHFYITRMRKLNEQPLNDEDDDSNQTTANLTYEQFLNYEEAKSNQKNINLTYLLDQQKHIYAEAIKIQRGDNMRSKMKNYGLGKLAFG